MTNAITKSTLISNIWSNFYNRIKDQVTTINISISPGTSTIQKYATGYNDIDFSSTDNFPIILVDAPRIPQEQFTFGKTQVNGTIEIEVYATNTQVADKFQDAINNAIETYKGTLAGVGIKMVELDDTDQDFIENGNIKVHLRRTRFKFVYHFTRTKAY